MVTRTSHFVQSCPVCGRPLRTAAEYQGRGVYCSHCRGRFVAADPCVPAAPGLSVLVVEWRDEAFARLAADLTGAGVRVVRGKNPKTAARRYLREPTDAVFVSARQPCESPWLFAAKLRLTHPRARVWVYTPSASPRDKEKAALLLHATPIEYGGDLSRLSREILSRLADFPQHAWS